MALLRDLIRQNTCLMAPGVYDCLSAKVAEEAGFEAISISGYSVEAARFGLPDLGFAGLSDITDVAERIAGAINIPIICDADTGYGGPANVRQTVRRLERTGVSALHIEDQAEPKKCGGLPGRAVISCDAMIDKLKAALDARQSEDLMIIARTDAKAGEGLERACDRLNAYLGAGADVAFFAEAYTRAELEALGAMINGPLALCAGVPGWPGSFATTAEFTEIGVQLALYPFSSLYVATRAMRETYAQMHAQSGISSTLADACMLSFDEFSDFIDVAGWSPD